MKLVSRYRIGPIFTPPVVSRAEGPIATLTMGAQAAASNWPGGSYDPETHTLYVANQASDSAPGSLSLVDTFSCNGAHTDGCEKARRLAQETMRDVREAMGLDYS